MSICLVWPRSWIVLLVIGVIASVLYAHFFVLRAYVEVDIQIYDDRNAFFKIYWSDGEQPFTERNSRGIQINPDESRYAFFLTNIGDIRQLRIDPIDYAGRAEIIQLQIRQFGLQPISLISVEDFEKLTPVQQITKAKYKSGKMLVDTDGRDGQLLLNINPDGKFESPLRHLINIVLIFIVVYMFVGNLVKGSCT